VEERGEPLLLPLPCGLPYAVQRLGHTFPTLCPVCALLLRVPLGPRPLLSPGAGSSLHRLRPRSPGFVRRLRRYYDGVRLLAPVHRRLRLLAFPWRKQGRGPARHSNRPAGHEISQSLPRRRPGFRRVPSRRDVVFDPGRAIAPRMTVRHMLPSACSDRLGLCDVKDFVAQYTPRRFAVIRFVAPVAGSNATTRYQAGATRYLGRTSTGWTAPAR